MLDSLRTPNSWISVIAVALIGGVIANFLKDWIVAGVGLLSKRLKSYQQRSEEKEEKAVSRLVADPALLAAAEGVLAQMAVFYCIFLILTVCLGAFSWALTTFPQLFAGSIRSSPERAALFCKLLAVVVSVRAMLLQYGAVHRGGICNEAWRRIAKRPQPHYLSSFRMLILPLIILGLIIYTRCTPIPTLPSANQSAEEIKVSASPTPSPPL
jgi:hypothetical protein